MYSAPKPFRPVPCTAANLAFALIGAVPAGFPSPAEGFEGNRLDLTEILVQHPQATFIVQARGRSMEGVGIFDGDYMVVDRALTARHGGIVIAVLDGGDYTVKQFHRQAGRIRLQAANPAVPDIVPRDGQTLEVWGVVTWGLRRFQT